MCSSHSCLCPCVCTDRRILVCPHSNERLDTTSNHASPGNVSPIAIIRNADCIAAISHCQFVILTRCWRRFLLCCLSRVPRSLLSTLNHVNSSPRS
ncbi:hypothetical protein RB319 [Rhodopirellula baltica SH 1]|uniref:Uncharacterized protein n=1 Tax=Rhodopirellula baltica (strain DSM 10527 / NCIMB 13988 / SH1) TaxID=243090 RepID=Q7UYY1_RHOBA|nr:hypothetical protein RB319 [Rhodopirellula baltica SH 1]